MGKCVQTQFKLTAEPVIFACVKMSYFLGEKFLPSLFWFGDRDTVRMNDHSAVFAISMTVDKQIVISAVDVPMATEGLIFHEKSFAVSQVSSHAHKWRSPKGEGNILDGGKESFILDQPI